MLTSLSSLITLHLTDWGSLSIWCLLVWLKCWQANSLWETSLLLPRHQRSGRAAKPTWMSVWAPRPSGIMLACQVLFHQTTSPAHFYLLCFWLFGWLPLHCVCTYVCMCHVMHMWRSESSLELAVLGIEFTSFVWHTLYLVRQIIALSDLYFNLFLLQFPQLNLSYLSVYPLCYEPWLK